MPRSIARVCSAFVLMPSLACAQQSAKPTEGQYEAAILARASELGILDHPEGLNSLFGVLAATFDHYPSVRPLSLIDSALRRPLSLDAVEARVSQRVMAIRDADAAGLPEAIRAFVRDALDLTGEPAGAEPAEFPEESIPALLDAARHNARTWRLRSEDHPQLVDAVAHALKTDTAAVAASLDALLAHWASPIGRGDIEAVRALNLPTIDPGAIGDAVTGDWSYAFTLPDGSSLIIGTDQANTYDMSRIDHVIDPSGNDAYLWPKGAAPTRTGSIIDLAGNDTYRSQADFAGPATCALGWSLLDDRSGDDTYHTTALASIATGVMGASVLIDRFGDDAYTATGKAASWNIGAGFFGTGLLIDLAGHDAYRGEKLTQGIGGARGLGAIIDKNGNDFYFANGPSNTSTYGTPAVYLGQAQGYGYGIRGHAAGGLGAIYDLGGHDEYTAGEFSQGGGYFFALGILRDTSGHDLYHANRYGQAFAAHQAAGILIDDAGDDTYWSRTAASQSGSWDECATLLIDRAGNDSYRCDGLGIGGAAMQAIAVFIDAAGDDRYAPAGGDTLGQSSRDSYHYERDKTLSFSAFMDLGGGHDSYPPRRSNGSVLSTGKPNDDEPANSTRFGVFVDE